MTATYPDAIIETHRNFGSLTHRLQVIRCTCPNCRAEIEVRAHGRRRPLDVLANMARRKGWHVKEKKGVFQCPNH